MSDEFVKRCHICKKDTEKFDRCDVCNKIACFDCLVKSKLYEAYCKRCDERWKKILKVQKEMGGGFDETDKEKEV